MNRFRRMLTRWEKKSENPEIMLHFTCGLIVIKYIAILMLAEKTKRRRVLQNGNYQINIFIVVVTGLFYNCM